MANILGFPNITKEKFVNSLAFCVFLSALNEDFG